MSDIGDMIERGGEGPEWVERASNDAMRKEITRLRAALDAAEVQAEHHKTMSLARQDEIERLRLCVSAWEESAQHGHPSPCNMGPLCPYCEIDRLRATESQELHNTREERDECRRLLREAAGWCERTKVWEVQEWATAARAAGGGDE